MRNFLKKFKPYFVGSISLIETVILTGIYYFFWRIGYSHGLPGYPEYFGKGKYILMIVYFILMVLLMFYTGGFKFGRLRAINIIIKQWGVLLAANLITYLQLSLTAGQPVAKRPLFDATLVQFGVVVVMALFADISIKRYHVFGNMIVIGEGIDVGASVDGYRVTSVYSEELNMLQLSAVISKVTDFDSVLINNDCEISDYIIEKCLQIKKPVYITMKESLLYGVKKMQQDGMNYVLILGSDDKEEHFMDRIRAYLA